MSTSAIRHSRYVPDIRRVAEGAGAKPPTRRGGFTPDVPKALIRLGAPAAHTLGDITDEKSYKEHARIMNLDGSMGTPPWDWETVQVVLDMMMTEAAYRALRDQRDKMLASSDHLMLPDVPGDKVAIASYRSALRDLPATCTPTLGSDGRLVGVTFPTLRKVIDDQLI